VRSQAVVGLDGIVGAAADHEQAGHERGQDREAADDGR
jgi:hypothetical protein